MAETVVCQKDSQCVVGLSCFNIDKTSGSGTCRKQAGDAEVCITDYDCLNTHGCNVDKKCKAYFSANLSDTVKYLEGDLSFCASGAATPEGVCISKTNVGTDPFPCSDTNACVYLINNVNVTEPNACACSKGNSLKQFCPLGNGMKMYQDYVSAFKAYLQKFSASKCHTVERSSCALANKADTNSYSQFYSSQIYARNYHILVDAAECVKKVIYPGLNGPIPPSSNGTCASVTCGKLSSPTCASFTFDAVSKKGSFTGQSCDSSKRCDVVPSIFDEVINVEKVCVNKTVTLNTR